MRYNIIKKKYYTLKDEKKFKLKYKKIKTFFYPKQLFLFNVL